MSWTIWLASSDTYIQPDSDSLIALADMGSLSEVAEPNWTAVSIKAVHPDKTEWVERAIAQSQNYQIKTIPVSFPEDMTDIESVYTALRKRYKYLCIDGSAQTADSKYPYRIHPVGYAINIKIDNFDTQHDDNSGTKTLTISAYKSRPVI